MKSGYECNSDDEKIGWTKTVQECADLCKSKQQCEFFIHGKGRKKGYCYWEKTSSADCPEGWDSDKYDFYQLITSKYENIVILFHTNKFLGTIISKYN